MRILRLVRSGTVIKLSIFFPGLLCVYGQELHYRAQIHSSSETFSVEIPPTSNMRGESLTLRNNTNSSVFFPALWSDGSAPPLGAFDIAAFLKEGATSDEEFAIRAWGFVLDHAMHYCSAGTSNMYLTDPMQILYGYGIGCCDQVAPILGWIWNAGGYKARIASMAFHTIPEIYYGNAWHMLDPDHRTFYRNTSGNIASVADIFANPAIVSNSGDSSGKDPLGSLSQLMAQLYVENAPTLTYNSIPAWPDSGVPFLLTPGESVQFTNQGFMPGTVAHPIPGASPISSVTFGSVTFTRHIDFTTNGLSYLDASSQLMLASEANGRKALTNSGTGPGSLTMAKTSPFPVLSLNLEGEFFVANSFSSLLVRVSADGITWTDPIPVPVVSGAVAAKYRLDLSQYVREANSAFVQVLLNGSYNDVQILSLDLKTQAQSSSKVFPHVRPGQINTFRYQDRSPVDQARAIDVELAIPNGSAELPIMAAQSLVPEDSLYSTAAGYGAANLIDGLATTLAYPGSRDIDYVLNLSRQSQVKQVSLWWGEYGTNDIYVRNWTLYGRSSPQAPWVILSQGGFPNASVSDISIDGDVTDLRITATSDNWIGLYLLKAYGDEVTPPVTSAQLTSFSQVPESPTYSISQHYGAANLVDGNEQTLAYPGSKHLDYVVGLGGVSHVVGATIRWGYFGTNPMYVNSWILYGRNGAGEWNILNSGGFPASETTGVALDSVVTDMRVVADSINNWVGVYEIQIAASGILKPVITANLIAAGDSGYPAANISDGNRSTVAYPSASVFDYELDFGSDTPIDVADINWGDFGSNPIYVNSWEILGQLDQDTNWTSVAHGGFPNSSETWARIHHTFRRLRIRATSSNWIGIYELSVYGGSLSYPPLPN